MADTPGVLKRLSEIEARAEESPVAMLRGDVHELIGLTRALLESQGELMAWQRAVISSVLAGEAISITTADEIAARAERVRKGEV